MIAVTYFVRRFCSRAAVLEQVATLVRSLRAQGDTEDPAEGPATGSSRRTTTRASCTASTWPCAPRTRAWAWEATARRSG